jgi:hypothetical protein
MNPFIRYLVTRKPAFLLEVSELFRREQFNDYWREQIDRLLPSVTDEDLQADLLALRQMDLVGYVDSSLRRVGLPADDLDEGVSQVVIHLLISPGKLISGWKREQPLSFRLKAAVKNAAITLGQRHAIRRKRRRELPADLPARAAPQDDTVIEQFRRWLRERLGDEAVRVFDQRLEGLDTKALVGSHGMTSYRVKALVNAIKAAAVAWGQSDPEFLARVQRLMGEEAGTMARRFGKKAVGV